MKTCILLYKIITKLKCLSGRNIVFINNFSACSNKLHIIVREM